MMTDQNQGRRRSSPVGCIFSLLALAIVIGVGIVGYNYYRSTTTNTTSASNCPTNKTVLKMYYGSEKQEWITDVVSDYNKNNKDVCIDATPIGSGQSMQQIVDGTIQPDIWSPAGSIWLTLLNSMWHKNHQTDIISTGASDTPSLVSSPVVIAMWKPMAEALGWPSKAIGWSDIAALSTNSQGWAAYGHPEFGAFKFGHTHPDYSNSGLDAVIAENYAAVNKTRGLTLNDINSASTQAFVTSVESSIIHYGDSTGFFADKMFNKGPNYLSATVMYESLVVQANQGQKYRNLAYPVVAIYPKEGTFYSDHPFAIPQASWVTPEKKAAALKFRDFLLAHAQQQKALQYGFRPADPNIALGSPIDTAHGVDPQQPQTLLQIPSADVVSAIQSTWNVQRHKVNVMLILDVSGSMTDQIDGVTKIDAAKKQPNTPNTLLGDDDQVGLTIFSDSSTVLSPVSLLGPKRQSLLRMINDIQPGGSTRLYDTIAEQVHAVLATSTINIKSVVVLTDGQDNISSRSVDQLVKEITPTGENAGQGIKVFTIAYGSDADKDGLTKVASATGGQEYAGNPNNIRQVYQQISLFF